VSTSVLRGEAGKLGAFLRRDWQVALSYRLASAFGVVSLVVQALLFALIGKLVDPGRLPVYGGTHATYAEFVAIGLVVGLVVALALERVATVVRQEQLQGTLEMLLVTPTALGTVQVGSAAFELFAVPIHALLLLGVLAVAFGLRLHVDGILPALVVLTALLPLVWGLGLAGAGAILTIRRGAGIVGLAATLMSVTAGAYFPLTVLPGWLEQIAAVNPLGLTLEGVRGALIGGTGWDGVGGRLAVLVPLSLAAMAVGVWVFRLAVERERRLGTLGMY
jgi:ABC-2 type transport system permease protein